MIVGVFGSLVIQTFKHVQRSKAEVSTIKELRTIVGSFEDEAQRYVLFESLMGRLHQGLHDSFVYDRCGSVECSDPTIYKSAVGTFLPRFLYPDKPGFNTEKLKILGVLRDGEFVYHHFRLCRGLCELWADRRYGIHGIV